MCLPPRCPFELAVIGGELLLRAQLRGVAHEPVRRTARAKVRRRLGPRAARASLGARAAAAPLPTASCAGWQRVLRAVVFRPFVRYDPVPSLPTRSMPSNGTGGRRHTPESDAKMISPEEITSISVIRSPCLSKMLFGRSHARPTLWRMLATSQMLKVVLSSNQLRAPTARRFGSRWARRTFLDSPPPGPTHTQRGQLCASVGAKTNLSRDNNLCGRRLLHPPRRRCSCAWRLRTAN